MSDEIVSKVDVWDAPGGRPGETLLSRGESMSMRLWHEHPGEAKDAVSRDYETIGFVIEGSAEIEAAGKKLVVKTGDSWVVPKGVKHRYKILEHFRAVEATSPPAEHAGPPASS